MSRFTPYLGIVVAIVVGILLVGFSGSVKVERAHAPVVQTASSTLSVAPTITLPPLTIPNLEPKMSQATTSEQKTPTTSTPRKVTQVPKTKLSPAPVATSSPVAVPAIEPVQPLSSGNAALDASAAALRAALVNIICYVPSGSGLHSISGSGVIVSPSGIILTNSHIAQYFLLADRDVSCTIRSGSPATDSYEASLIYIPSAWISANATVLTQSNPSGNGEYDFAFLAVTKSATRNNLPTSFPSIPLAVNPPNTSTSVVIASYGAQFLESSQIRSSLFPTIVFGSVKDIFTFASTTIDVLALGGSAAAQEGSSGGGVADASGKLVGTITTSTTQGTTDTRKMDAITASYIRAEYASETGNVLDLLLTASTTTSIADFAPKMPALESVLTAQFH